MSSWSNTYLGYKEWGKTFVQFFYAHSSPISLLFAFCSSLQCLGCILLEFSKVTAGKTIILESWVVRFSYYSWLHPMRAKCGSLQSWVYFRVIKVVDFKSKPNVCILIFIITQNISGMENIIFNTYKQLMNLSKVRFF